MSDPWSPEDSRVVTKITLSKTRRKFCAGIGQEKEMSQTIDETVKVGPVGPRGPAGDITAAVHNAEIKAISVVNEHRQIIKKDVESALASHENDWETKFLALQKEMEALRRDYAAHYAIQVQFINSFKDEIKNEIETHTVRMLAEYGVADMNGNRIVAD